MMLQRSQRAPSGVDCANADAFYEGRLEFSASPFFGSINQAWEELRWVRGKWPRAETGAAAPASLAACRIGKELRAAIHPAAAGEPLGLLELQQSSDPTAAAPATAHGRIQFGSSGHDGYWQWKLRQFTPERCDDVYQAADQAHRIVNRRSRPRRANR